MKFTNIELPYHFKISKEQGLTNDLFILNDKYFVKRSKETTKVFLNWENQINVVNLIKSQAFTLPILEIKISEEKLWTLMPYFQNLITLKEYKIDEKILATLANLVTLLHNVEVKNNEISTWNAIEQLNLYCNLVIIEDKIKEKINPVVKELESWLKTYQPEKIVLSHNDLIIDNFVVDKNKWYLIDWDFATLNDHLFDIASFASETLKEEKDINEWYQMFQLTNEERKNVAWWIKYQNLIWYHWALYLHQKTNNRIYQTIASEKLKMLFA